jgi:dihydrolipoamide dehydrogenase
MVIGEAIGSTDVAIIGAGPGGYVAAIRLAELGKKVTLVDRESVGGVCLHHGCIPTKALIHAADFYHRMQKSRDFGITFDNAKVDFNKVQQWKNNIVNNLDNGTRALLKYHKIELIKASAFFESSNKIGLRGQGDEHLEINALEYKKCIIATGSRERELPGLKIDGDKIISSTHAIELDRLPESILIVGGGYIGIELSQMFAKLGVKVYIIEALASILNQLDEEFCSVVRKTLIGIGAEIYENSKVEKTEIAAKVKTIVSTPDGKKEFTTEKVIVAIGRIPNTEELQLKNTKVQMDKSFIKVNSSLQTDDARIYAIGDVIGGVMLAHKASYEAKVAAESICGKKSIVDALVPYAIFSDPEISGVGLTEKEAKEKCVKYSSKRMIASSLGKQQIEGSRQAFFKVLVDEEKNILGIHILGPRASDMVGEAILAMEMGATIEDLSLIIHPHPTIVEGFGEMADLAMGTPTNVM